jgi:hypothetical protein
MDRACSDFLVVNIIFAVVNTILMSLLVWQLWVVRSRFDRLEFVASFVGGIINRVRGVALRVGWLVEQIGRAVERATMGR